MSVQITSKVLVKATYQAPAPTNVTGVTMTFYRTNAHFRTGPSRDIDQVIGTALADANGVATLLIDGFTNKQSNTTSTIIASLEADGRTLTSVLPATINFLTRPAGVNAPSLEVSNNTVTPGENITVVVTALDRAGDPVPNAPLTATVRGPASVTVTKVDPKPPVREASRRVLDTETNTTTDANGHAMYIINSVTSAQALVSATFFLNAIEEVFLPGTTLTWQSAGVTSIKLTPEHLKVSVGRYAQLSATLTPALQGVKVDFTAVRVSPLEAQLESATNDADALSWGEPAPDTITQEAQPAADAANRRSAEGAYHKRPSAGSSRTETSSAVSNSLGVATISFWHRRPATYHVTASVTNPDGSKVTSNPATVKWVDGDSSYGDSDSPYYKTHTGHDDYYPGDHNNHGDYKHNRPEDYRGSKGSEGPDYKHVGEEYKHVGGKKSEGPYKNHGHSDDYSAKKNEKDHYKKGHEDTYKHAK